MIADKLKKSVLQAAIQGKLTEQLASDGDANDLLKQIRAEKDKLIAEGKIKAEKSLSPITPEELPFDIPENWQWVKLGDISLKIQYGFTASANVVGNVKLLRITDIQNNKVDWQHVPYCTISESQKNDYLLHNNDLVIARTGGTVGKTFIVEHLQSDAVFASYLIRLVFGETISAKYIKIFSGSPFYWQQITDKVKGTGQPNVNGQSLSNLVLPLPPLAEQERIVERVEEILSEIEQLAGNEHELEELQKKFPRRMKNSLLQAAIQGRLTTQLASDGDAKDLLEKIRTEKSKLIAEGSLKIEKDLPTITPEELPFDIPENWAWCRLGEICEIFTGNSISESEKKSKYLGLAEGFSYIGTKDVSFENKVDYDNGIKIPFKNNFKRALKDSVLLCIEGGSAGRKIALTDREVCFGKKLCNFHSETISNRYIYFYLQSPAFRKNFYDNLSGMIGGVSIKKLNLIPICLPPLAEQKRIVERLEELLPLCEI